MATQRGKKVSDLIVSLKANFKQEPQDSHHGVGVLVANAVGREDDVAHLVDGGVALVDEPAQDLGGFVVVAGLVLLLG